MSKFTTELRYIIENEKLIPPTVGDLSLTNILNSYPLENANLINPLNNKTRRQELNETITNHYYFREISLETVPRFLFYLQRKLNEIMPYYNQMFKSVDFDFNPIWNVDMNETFEHTITDTGKTTTEGTNTSNGNNSNEGLNVASDTPNQGITETDIKNNLYASSTNHGKNTITTDNTDTSNGEINSTGTKTESFTRREFGSSKGYTFAQNIEQWRNIMINVNMMITEELNELFMNVY